MDDRSFDNLTRAVAAGGTRRGVLRGLLGGALGGPLALLGGEAALAGCFNPGQRCRR